MKSWMSIVDLVLFLIPAWNIGFESFVVVETPLPMKSAAAVPSMWLHRKMSKKKSEVVLVERKVKVGVLADGRDSEYAKQLSCRWVKRNSKACSASSDYYLYPRLKRWIIINRLIIDSAEEYFADFSENNFSDGIKSWIIAISVSSYSYT